MRSLVVLLLSRRWGWLALGALVFAFGGYWFAQAHPIHPVEIDGTIAHFREWTKADGVYDHHEIDLNGDNNAYTFNKYDFQPSLPQEAYRDGKVSIWIEQGTTNVVALTLYDQNDKNPTKYTTDLYDHPDHKVLNDHLEGGIAAGAGGVLLLVGLLWPMFPFGRKKPRPNASQSRSGNSMRRPPSPGYGPPGRSYGQQPEYGSQPGYGPPPGYRPQRGYSRPPGYGPQREYGPPPAYGTQQGYGTLRKYGPPPEYGSGDPNDPNNPPDPRRQRGSRDTDPYQGW